MTGATLTIVAAGKDSKAGLGDVLIRRGRSLCTAEGALLGGAAYVELVVIGRPWLETGGLNLCVCQEF